VLNTPFLTSDITYTLVSVSSSGVPSCATPASGSVSFSIVALPIVTVSSAPVCVGNTATVAATPAAPGNYNFTWTVPAGATNPGNVQTFTTAVPGTYSLIMGDLTTTCPSNPVPVDVVINPLPIVTVSVTNSPICPGQSATIAAVPATPGTYSYVWTVPAGVTPPGNVASFSSTIAGTYSVVITNTATNCVSTSASGTLAISPLPTVAVSAPAVCAGTAATVTATPGTAGNYSYVWTVPTGATNPGNVASFSTSIVGLYSVIITNTLTSCSSASASATVLINPLPTVTVVGSPLCTGASSTVNATPGVPGNYSYSWTVPNGATNPGNVATFSTSIPGTYSVVVTNSTTNCPSAIASTNVVVNALPTVAVTLVNQTICPGESAVVTAVPGSAGTYNYNWTVPAGVPAPGNVSTFNTSIAGVYSVTITDTATT
ncbi:MAG: PKD domain-containing protein, partial [Bacteroidota bacterium]